ncbi:DUF3871 family protein [Aestuariibaculum sp. M13]|uniref:DUF3871 family protein n=1 Tax=Aestuariibaculum sp. M13 TaxID=2967132 RepID=UPI002159CAE1|nr:DUF3871 family protein [Aestuariibaculum sp. M13]MCR8667084.1 DUF3871 family protein [Aestuariibaculum sp. M13]
MELIQRNNQVINENDVVTVASPFIEANTKRVSLEHLKNECTIPVFSKDNEVTISHYQFISKTIELLKKYYPTDDIKSPDIRVSHIIKGRVPSAIGKPVKELLDHEKTIYYERCAFVVNIPSVTQTINGNTLCLSAGGVRAYNQENLYAKKSLEKFKLFIGFRNKVCTNTCVSTDGLADKIRVGSVDDLETHIAEVFQTYSMQEHLDVMTGMARYRLSERQFAHFIGRARMLQYLDKKQHNNVFPLALNDSQINTVVKEYYTCENFSRSKDGSISLWNLYNLLTEANKSSYIDSFLERGVSAYEFVKELSISIENKTPNWYLNNL